jgi:ferredoxin-nitrite reductase
MRTCVFLTCASCAAAFTITASPSYSPSVARSRAGYLELVATPEKTSLIGGLGKKIRSLFGTPQGSKWSIPALAWAPRSINLPKETTGTSYLPADTLERCEAGTKFEKIKLSKDTTQIFTDMYDYAAKIRSGELNWEDVDDADINTRLKWAGLLHRAKRNPGTFMMRLRVHNGIVSSEQMNFYADTVEPYGPDVGVIDITTRQNIQLRGVTLADGPGVIDGLHALNQTCIQTGFDNIRNMVGNPLAGIDEHEMVDTRPFCNMLTDLVTLDTTTGERGNPEYCNLGRKFNICVSGNRDDFAHTHINDIGFVPAAHKETGEMGFNVVFGGYMSIKRVAASIPLDIWVPATLEATRALSVATLRIFRDEGNRSDRQKARLMWIIEKYGPEAFREKLLKEPALEGVNVQREQPEPEGPYERRELLGVHKQPDGAFRVGVHVPTGRLSAEEARQIATLADKYSGGEIRLTVEQNFMLVNVAEAMLPELLAEPALTKGRFSVEPGHIVGHTVACTGAKYCGLALIETKLPAEGVAEKLDKLISTPRPLRIHWTGCPNSCAQVQVADIGLMGAPAKKMIDGKAKAVPGVNIFVGGTIGENAFLALEPYKKGVPMADDDILPVLVEIAKEKFGAVDK